MKIYKFLVKYYEKIDVNNTWELKCMEFDSSFQAANWIAKITSGLHQDNFTFVEMTANYKVVA